MSKYTRLGKNIFWVFLGNTGSKFIGLLMLPLYTQWLSVEDYGTTDIIGVYVAFLLCIVTCSISESVFIFPKGKDVNNQKAYFSSGLFFSTISFCLLAILFLLIDVVSSINQYANSFIDHIWLIYGMLIAMFLQQYVQQFTRSIDKMKIYSITGIVLTIMISLFSFILIPSYGVTGYVLSMITAYIISALYSFFFSKSYSYLSIRSIRKDKIDEMLRYSIPLVPNGVMWWLVGSFNRPIMESYLGMTAIGLFAVANKFPGILITFFNMFAISWQISVIEEFKKDGYNRFFNNIFRIVITCLVILSCIITFFSKIIVSVFASEVFFESWRYVPVLMLSVVFLAMAGLYGSNFSATRESKYFFYSSIWGAIASILFNFLLIPTFGIMGAALSVSISFFVMAIARMKYAWKYVKIENISLHVAMLLSHIGFILITLYIESLLIRSISLALMLTFLIIANFCNRRYRDSLIKLLKKQI